MGTQHADPAELKRISRLRMICHDLNGSLTDA